MEKSVAAKELGWKPNTCWHDISIREWCGGKGRAFSRNARVASRNVLQLFEAQLMKWRVGLDVAGGPIDAVVESIGCSVEM